MSAYFISYAWSHRSGVSGFGNLTSSAPIPHDSTAARQHLMELAREIEATGPFLPDGSIVTILNVVRLDTL